MTRAELLLRAFHDICREVKVEPRDSLRYCELTIKDLGLINIVDLIDAKRCGKKVHIWPRAQFQGFRDYTLRSRDKCMAFDIARQHDLLRALLQNLTGKKAAEHARMMAMRQRHYDVPSFPRGEISRPVPTGPAARAAASSHNAYDTPTPSSAVAVALAGAAVQPVKEDAEPELPLNPNSPDLVLPTIICSQQPPFNAAASQPSPPAEPSQQQPPQPGDVVKRESPQLPPMPSVRPHTTITHPYHRPTPDTSSRATTTTPPPKERTATPSTTPVRISARIAAIKEESTDGIKARVTQQKNKRKNITLTEILDNDNDVHDTPTAKKLKQGTPSRALVRSTWCRGHRFSQCTSLIGLGMNDFT